ncbi:hypothetical protein EVA_14201, partial [gut metagenome]
LLQALEDERFKTLETPKEILKDD